MGRIVARVLGAVFVLWAVVTLAFFGAYAIPGDPAEAVVGGAGSRSTPEQLAQISAQYGFDRPLWVQYLDTLGDLLHGDLGTSYSLKTPVATLIGQTVGGTLVLAAASLAVAWAVAIIVALGSTRDSRLGTALGSLLEVTSVAVPHFWLGSVLILLFSVGLGWLPPISTPGPSGLVLPVLSLALPLAGFLGQVMRESFIAALDAPFTLSARARGETETRVRLVHALRHAALPAISLSGWAFGSLISGAVVVETLFSRPGLGRTLLAGVLAGDIPVIVGVVLVIAAVYVLVTFATEAADRIADPRLKAAARPTEAAAW
ncbi:peptide/nickel transport system permease protein [Actinocorallia herbida]|uniref:Peptide/nickel transport system permease protein n=1 Tax=Actinocorallia herbida TaxID=58109 RepID=A0A3N1CVS7_9ACTN|nr:ABC transporter permease [Actinocorallia herbida]ROO85403.1 peptide/nickel transport system permease protein [Actinocorallia herbida]